MSLGAPSDSPLDITNAIYARKHQRCNISGASASIVTTCSTTSMNQGAVYSARAASSSLYTSSSSSTSPSSAAAAVGAAAASLASFTASSSSPVDPALPSLIPPYLTTVRIRISAGTIALLLLFFSATFHSLAKYFYSYYRLVFGTLYPSYASYKAIKNKNIKEYARWMMFWVSFGIFSFVEVFTDLLLGFWLPFYHEIKILFILWLMSPYGNGAKVMYKNVIHPELHRREEVIDSYIEKAKEIGISSLFTVWSKASDCVNVLVIRMIHMTQAIVLSHMERIVNATGEEVATSSSIISLPPASSSSFSPSSTSSQFNSSTIVTCLPSSTVVLPSGATSSSKAVISSTSIGDLSKPIRLGHKRPPPQPPTGDVKDSLKLLDDAINFYENDTSSISSSTANLNFEPFSSSQGEESTEDESESTPADVIEYSSATLPSRRMSGVKLTPLGVNQATSQQINPSTRGYFSQQDIPSVEMSMRSLEERIEARIRRNRIRPTVRPSILLDAGKPDPSVFSRK